MALNTTALFRAKVEQALNKMIEESDFNLGDISPSSRSKKEKIDFKKVYNMPVSYDTVRRIFKGQRVTRSTVIKVAQRLGIDYCDKYHVIRHSSELEEPC